MITALGMGGGFLILWWHILFVDYRMGFIGRYGSVTERRSSILVQCVLVVVIFLIICALSILSSIAMATDLL